jgi:hypothetical protein
MVGSSEAIDLRVWRREKGLRLGEFGELLGQREALDRGRQHGVRIGVAIGRVIQLRERHRGAQFEAARFLRLRDGGARHAARQMLEDLWREYGELYILDGVGRVRTVCSLLWLGRFNLLTEPLALGKFGVRPDSLVEGSRFELPVPRCALSSPTARPWSRRLIRR